MDLEFKPDFEDVRRRWAAFWQGKRLDRPVVAITVLKEGREPVAKPVYTSGADGNFGPVIDQLLVWANSYYFLGDYIPFHYLEFGPDHFSSLLGADLAFHPDSPNTSWCVPFVRDWDDADIRFRPDSFWWSRTREFIRELRRRCDGKLLIAAPTLVSGLDCLAAIRGQEALLLDVATVPDKIHRVLGLVNAAYRDILDALARELDYAGLGSITRHAMYSPGRISVPQCDFSCMISPAMFREFEVPCLLHETSLLDAAEYHLDGPGALRHLPALAQVPGIGVIQWQPGAGEAATGDWSELYRTIDGLGKGLILSGEKDRCRAWWENLSSRKLFFGIPASDRREADRILLEMESWKKMARWTCGGKEDVHRKRK